MGYKVSAPLVYLRVPDVAGALVSYSFYQGAPVPENVDKASLQHHLDSGLVVEEKDPVAELLAVPSGTPIPGEPPNRAVSVQDGGPVNLEERVENVTKAAERPAPKPAKR